VRRSSNKPLCGEAQGGVGVGEDGGGGRGFEPRRYSERVHNQDREW
jgi:hypothetical protein